MAFEFGQGGLWREVIDSKYGGWRGLKEQQTNNSKVSLWWNDLTKVWRSEEWGGKFEDCWKWEVGNRRNVSFWSDSWVISGDLKSRFSRLFSLSESKEANLCDCGIWVNGVWEWKLRWRRIFFTWEEEQARQLLEKISNKRLKLEIGDRWVWKDSETEGYSVKSAYEILRGERGEEDSRLYKFIWKIKALPSAHVTTWRVIENRVASKVNLERRGIGVESNICIFCRTSEESTEHLCFGCRVVWLVWNLCYD